MKHVLTRAGALLGATALATMAMGPALAAETVAQADANALTVSGAGEGGDSGTVRATHDGDKLTKTGETEPPISVLGGQDLLDVGTLAQDATAGLDGRDGVSAACSGIAGDGASVAEVGDSECLTGGDNVGVSIANLDLSEAQVINDESIAGELATVLGPLEAALLGPVTAALTESLAPFDLVDVGGTVGVVEARCDAEPGSADGSANIADGRITATVDGAEIELLSLPVQPAPNTKVVTDLDEVLNAIIEGFETNFEESLAGAASGLTDLTDELQAQLVDTAVAELSDQLTPLEQNVLDITLNKQVRPAQGHIEVTGIDLQVLPAAAGELGAPLVSAQIANVSCGPNARVAGSSAPSDLPEVPTVVDAGVGGPGQGAEDATGALVAGSLLAVGVAGLLGYRRLTTR